MSGWRYQALSKYISRWSLRVPSLSANSQDVRHASLITLATPLDPIRALCFAPRQYSTADPFQLISAYESGNIARWDLRMPKNPVERLMAHHGGVLSIDWKGGTEAAQMLGDASSDEVKAASSYGWGWLATAGMDGTVKVSGKYETVSVHCAQPLIHRFGTCPRHRIHLKRCILCILAELRISFGGQRMQPNLAM